ncbi:uncharacterized protein CIMG_04735 [Coccidioides immitis RS]|uniref:Uncharacterized protein n=2 Tax=Coccidioides immitis TaxID=5501 RepID=J3KE42_COCIM|nr:uncharacterized protein CIMG_04735 [Coccidioides immitis RS]EAS33711.3 hypothetical protein CIMG_04735 [Coccidioides immitis RS]KMP04899.1 hypothetical protein CIRG_04580 [Coccidioides immitis RMSCC 2394]
MSGSQSLMRAFTKRQKRPKVSAPMPFREGQVKFAPGTIDRSRISPAIELISSTNVLAYTAPDLPSTKSPNGLSSSSSSSFRSADDLDVPNFTPITSPATSTRDESPVSTEPSLPPYFESTKRPKPSARSSASSSRSKDATPPIPQRALLHTKSQPNLGREGPPSKMTLPPISLNNPASSRVNYEPYNTLPESTHPFMKELEQVNEVAEEFTRGVRDEEEEILLNKGLKKFAVEDYIFEIQDLYQTYFGDELGERQPMGGAWI